nr:hypothetical protein [Tanacetum cinerariifolium]
QETDQTSNLTDYQLARDREPRIRTKPLMFRDESNMVAYAFIAAEEEDTHEPLTYQEAVSCEDTEEEDTHEPLTYQEAVSCEDSSKWKAAMKEEIKKGIEGVQNPRYKARLVARGFTQRADIDYNEIFSLVVRHTFIRVILALTACKDYELEQLDVKTAFLHEKFKEMIYMRQPPGYEQGNKEFDMKELGEAKKILSMEIVRDRSCKILRVLQSGYVFKILTNFRMDNGKSVKMPLGENFKFSLTR